LPFNVKTLDLASFDVFFGVTVVTGGRVASGLLIGFVSGVVIGGRVASGESAGFVSELISAFGVVVDSVGGVVVGACVASGAPGNLGTYLQSLQFPLLSQGFALRELLSFCGVRAYS
jgi:hypothetical protein